MHILSCKDYDVAPRKRWEFLNGEEFQIMQPNNLEPVNGSQYLRFAYPDGIALEPTTPSAEEEHAAPDRSVIWPYYVDPQPLD